MLLATLMVKHPEGLPSAVVDILLWAATFLPIGACAYIMLSEIWEYRKYEKSVAETGKADEGEAPLSKATGHGGASSECRKPGEPEPMMVAPIAPMAFEVEPPEVESLL